MILSLNFSFTIKKCKLGISFTAPTENEHYHLQVGHDTSLKIMAITDKQCRSSSSVNGSASGSKYGSNGHNGSETGLRAEHAVTEDGNGTASGRSGGSGANEDRVAQRAAALTKFRQKRKERCFEKKVIHLFISFFCLFVCLNNGDCMVTIS